MSMDDSSQWRSAPRWERAWSQLARCISNGSTVPYVIGWVPSPARRTPSPNVMALGMRWWARPLFDHNFHRAHRALRLPVADCGVRRYHHRSPAMALGLTNHRWSFLELLT